MEMCVKCGVRPAVMYITKMENGKTSMEGYCLSCAKELGLAPVDQMFEKFGIGADEIESINEQMNDMIESMGGPEGLQEMEQKYMPCQVFCCCYWHKFHCYGAQIPLSLIPFLLV